MLDMRVVALLTGLVPVLVLSSTLPNYLRVLECLPSELKGTVQATYPDGPRIEGYFIPKVSGEHIYKPRCYSKSGCPVYQSPNRNPSSAVAVTRTHYSGPYYYYGIGNRYSLTYPTQLTTGGMYYFKVCINTSPSSSQPLQASAPHGSPSPIDHIILQYHKDATYGSYPLIGDWTSWSSCNVSCGQGVRTRQRTCKSNPPYIQAHINTSAIKPEETISCFIQPTCSGVTYLVSWYGYSCTSTCASSQKLCASSGHGIPSDSALPVFSAINKDCRTRNDLDQVYSVTNPPGYLYQYSKYYCMGFLNVSSTIDCSLQKSDRKRLCPCISKPAPPSNVVITAINSTAINITWIPPSLASAQYTFLVYRSTLLITTLSAPQPALGWIVVFGLKAYTSYCVKGQASIAAGDGDLGACSYVNTQEGVPSVAPHSITVQALSTTTLQITWHHIPSDSVNGALLGYNLFYRTCSSADWRNLTVTSSYSSTVLTNLYAGTCYCVQIAGYTGVGIGVQSACVNGTTKTPGPTRPPQNLTATVNSSKTIMLTWAPVPPEHTHGAITSYAVLCHMTIDPHESVEQRHCAKATAANISELDPYTEYCCKIAAYNAQPTMGMLSECVNTTTFADVPEGAPQSVSAYNTSSTSVRVLWQHVLPSLRNGPISRYSITYQHTNDSDNGTVTMNGNCTLAVNITGLLKFSTYCVRVQMVSRYGVGPLSTCVLVTTDEDVPDGPPSMVTGQALDSTRLEVQWRPPPVSNGHVLAYKVYLTSLYPTQGHNLVKTKEGLKNRVWYLHKFTVYCVQVSAVTRVGEGPKSACTNISTAEDVPSSPPQSITITNITSRSVSLSWREIPLDSQHSIITGYRIHYDNCWPGLRPRNVTVKADRLGGDITRLWPYTCYSVRVAGVSKVGEGSSSQCLNETTRQEVPSGVPQIVFGANTSSTSLVIRWSAVPQHLIHGRLTGYTVSFMSLNDSKAGSVNATVREVALRHLRKYAVYCVQVAVLNELGHGPTGPCFNLSTGEDVPSQPPTNIRAQGFNATAVEVTWSHVSDVFRHGRLRGYSLRVSQYPSNNSTVAIAIVIRVYGNATMRLVAGLEPFSRYCVTMAAFTIKGNGVWSACVNVTTLESTPSGPPQHISATNTSSTTIQVQWQPVHPDKRHGIIRGYRVLVVYNTTSSDLRRNRTLNGSAYHLEVEELRKFTAYYVAVTAFTSGGEGPWSDFIQVMTNGDAPSEQPKHITGRNLSATSLAIQWESPPGDSLNGKLLGFSVILYRTDQNAKLVSQPYKLLTFHGTNATAVLAGLHKGINYCIQVAAFTEYGTGNYSNCSYVATNEDAPSLPPQNSTILSTGSSTLLVTWSPIPWQNCNGIIQGYILKLIKVPRRRRRSINTDGVISITVAKGATSYEFQGLEKETDYCAEVVGFTAAGVGNGSSCVHGVTQATDNIVPNVSLHSPPGPTTIKLSLHLHKHAFMVDSGFLRSFEVRYRAVRVAGKGVFSSSAFPSVTILFPGRSTTIKLQKLETYTTYAIEVAAVTRHGTSDYSSTIHTETCRCTRRLQTNWYANPPFSSTANATSAGGVIPSMLIDVIKMACGACDGRRTVLYMSHPHPNVTLMKGALDVTDITFPVSAVKGVAQLRGVYVPLVRIPGVLVLSRDRVPSALRYAKVVTSSIFQCWPVLVINIAMMILAGAIMWMLEHGSNAFPTSAVSGIPEGIWWAMVTMTTVGYGDRSPQSLPGRVFGVIWALVGLVMSSILVAAISSSLAFTVIDEIHSSGVKRGETVAAIGTSPEHVVAQQLSRGRANYTTYASFQELLNAFEAGRTSSIVVDPYTVESQPALFNGTWYKISKIVSEDISYGVILGEEAVKLERHFREYVQSNVATVKITQKVDNANNSTESQESIAHAPKPETVNFLDPSSPLFSEGLYICGLALLGMVLLGLAYHVLVYTRCKRGSKVQSSARIDYDRTVQDLRELLEDFHRTFSTLHARLKHEQMREHVRGAWTLKLASSSSSSSL